MINFLNTTEASVKCKIMGMEKPYTFGNLTDKLFHTRISPDWDSDLGNER